VKIKHSNVYTYRLPLEPPLILKKERYEFRGGLLIRLMSESGAVGWGEVAPLPGFSVEDLSDATSQMRNITGAFIGQILPQDVRFLDGRFEQWLTKFELSPSVRCGIEMAVLNLLAVERNLNVASLFSGKPLHRILINALITGDQDEAVQQIRNVLSNGYSVVKMKVGSFDLDNDIARTRAVSEVLGDRATLRLDANRAWSLDKALGFAEGIGGCQVDYIEEPVMHSEERRVGQACRSWWPRHLIQRKRIC